MKISINTPIARLTADLQEEQVAALLKIALDYATGGTGNIDMPMDATQPAGPPPKIQFHKEERQPTMPATAEVGYKGFLYIKCEACGSTKGFCVKAPIKESHCECGHTTPLSNLKPLYVNCKCGDSFKYQTNLTESLASMNCLKCGAPVDLEYHEKKGVYETIE